MPTYQYQCLSCAHDFASRQSINDPAPQCPVCGGVVRKSLTASAIHGHMAKGRQAAMNSLTNSRT